MDIKHYTRGFFKKAWLWISEQNNHRAIISLATILAVIVAVWLGIQQNSINDKLLRLEELRHAPLIAVTIEKMEIQEPRPEEHVPSWGVITDFNVSNIGSVPVEILGYKAGELVLGDRVMRQRDNEYFNEIPEESEVVQIIATDKNQTFHYGNVSYDQKPDYDSGYKLKVFFKEYPEGENQCIEVRYYHETINGVSGFTEFQYSCAN